MSFGGVYRHYQCINRLSMSLIQRAAFDEIHVLVPDPSSPEAGFIRATSWLYCLYFEGGRPSISFFRRLGEAYEFMNRSDVDRHIEAVRCLRTELHHNLGYADSARQVREEAELWRRRACGTTLPGRPDDWLTCYNRLVEEAEEILRSIEQLVRKLEADEGAESERLDEWRRCLDHHWPAASFDLLIEEAAHRMGLRTLKTVPFRNRHVDRWRRNLDTLEDGFDFEREATLLIEKALLDDDCYVLPITGRELMQEFDIAPGPQVGRLLGEARRIHQSHPCEPHVLMDRLRDYLQTAD